MPLSISTRLPRASGCPAAQASPQGPPKSCTTKWARRTPRRETASRLRSAGMRDYMQAVCSRVVVFDGGMGATLEQLDLTPRDYGGLPGKCHEALILHRPDVIQTVHESMLEA